LSIKVNDSKDPVAEQDSLLVQVDYANQPIPNNRLPKGLYYSFKDKWVDMITLLTPAIKKIITANTTVPAWGSITGTLSNQTDLQSALDTKMSSDLTDSHIFVGDATNKATDVEMTGDITIDNTGATALANTTVTAGTYGDTTNVPQITVDAKGRITGASNVGISISSALGYTPENVANKATSLTSPDNTKYPTTQAVQTELDLKANKATTLQCIGINTTPAYLTNNASEQIMQVIEIQGGIINVNDILHFESLDNKAGTVANTGMRLRVSDVPNPSPISSATLLATWSGANTAVHIPMTRNKVFVKSATSTLITAPATSIFDDNATAQSYSSINIDYTVTKYFIFTAQSASANADVITKQFSKISK